MKLKSGLLPKFFTKQFSRNKKKLVALAPLAIKAQKCVQCTWTKDITTGEQYFGLDDVPDLPGFPGNLNIFYAVAQANLPCSCLKTVL